MSAPCNRTFAGYKPTNGVAKEQDASAPTPSPDIATASTLPNTSPERNKKFPRPERPKTSNNPLLLNMAGLQPFSLLSARLQFRRFLTTDSNAILSIRNDPNILQFLPWWTALSPDQGWAYLAVIDRQSHALVAICFLKVDGSGQQAEIGLMLSPRWRERGYEQEVLRSLGLWAKVGADGPRVQRITITVDARDTAVLAGSGSAGFAVVSQGLWAGQFPYYIAAL